MSVPRIALAAALAIACSGGSPVSPGPAVAGPGPAAAATGSADLTEVELRFDETVELGELALRWLELADSRCPIGVECVWEGQVVVTLDVARGDEPPVEIELLLRVGETPETARAFDHEFRLLDVEPHPRYGVTPERAAYVARIGVAAPS